MIIGKRRIVIVAAFFGALCRAGAAFATSELLPAYPEQPLLGPQAAKGAVIWSHGKAAARRSTPSSASGSGSTPMAAR